jgi:elongation factor Ts
MAIPLDLIKQLRQLTSLGVSDCRKALEEAGCDLKKAAELLRKKSLEIAQEKSDRATKEGRIEAYVHHGSRLGVLVEINCETDFVAKNEELSRFTKDIAMQIAATNPRYIKKEDVPAAELVKYEDKEKYYKESCLLEQPFIKDLSIVIKDYLGSLIAKTGENIVISRFVRFQVGKD